MPAVTLPGIIAKASVCGQDQETIMEFYADVAASVLCDLAALGAEIGELA